MHKFFIPTLLAGGLMMSGCAAGIGGDPLGGLLSTVLGGGTTTQGSSNEFERVAVDSCGREAQRYGRVSISNVGLVSRDTVRVDGSVQANNQYQRRFTCSFRSDGRIVDFRID